MKRFFFLLLVLCAGTAAATIQVLDEREQVFVTFLGDPDSPAVLTGPIVQGPGFVFRIPLLHSVRRVDSRVQIFESPPIAVRTKEQQQVQIRYYVLWRVADLRRLTETTPGEDLLRAIDRSTEGQVRSALGAYSVEELLSAQRAEYLQKIREDCTAALGERGIEVVGLSLSDLTFPDANMPSIFARMQQERNKVAGEIRAQGEGSARRIRAEAEAEAKRVLATARGSAARARGEGEARSAEIYANAYGEDPEFYRFMRSLTAYEKALDPKTTIVLTPESPFLRYLFQEE